MKPKKGHAASATRAGKENGTAEAAPRAQDIERIVLATLLQHAGEVPQVIRFVKPACFDDERNQGVFEAIREVTGSGAAVDVVTVTSLLRERGRLEILGGATYLAELCGIEPDVQGLPEHANALHRRWRERRRAAEKHGDVHLADAMKSAFERLTEAAEDGACMSGISTGYERLDAMTSGLFAGDLVVVASRPGMGKTALVLNIAVNIASPRSLEGGAEAVPGQGVLLFTPYTSRQNISMRMTCCEGRVDLQKMRSGWLQPDDWRRLTESASYLSRLPIWIDDTPTLGVEEMVAKIKRTQAAYDRPPAPGQPERKLAVVIIDYLQFLQAREGAQNREEELSRISRDLKIAARELGVALLVVSTLNRAAETRMPSKRPALADLRGSGTIEDEADVVLLLYRDEYYNPETTRMQGIAEVIIAKQRNGPTGRVALRFHPSYARLDNLAPDEYPYDDE